MTADSFTDDYNHYNAQQKLEEKISFNNIRKACLQNKTDGTFIA